MKKRNLLIAAALAVSLVMAACGSGDDTASANTGAGESPRQRSVVERNTFRADMRALWEDHITWTRLFIVSAVDGLKDTDVTAARLLANQKDIGDAIKPFFGDDAGTKLNELLDEHILVAADLIGTAKAGDDKAVTRGSGTATATRSPTSSPTPGSETRTSCAR
jgi:hypothetical protein